MIFPEVDPVASPARTLVTAGQIIPMPRPASTIVKNAVTTAEWAMIMTIPAPMMRNPAPMIMNGLMRSARRL